MNSELTLQLETHFALLFHLKEIKKVKKKKRKKKKKKSLLCWARGRA